MSFFFVRKENLYDRKKIKKIRAEIPRFRNGVACNLTAEQLRKCFSLTLKSLDTTINFIKSNNLKNPSRIDYITYLTGYFVFAQTDNLPDEKCKKLIKWYNETSFTNKPNGKRRDMFNELLKI